MTPEQITTDFRLHVDETLCRWHIACIAMHEMILALTKRVTPTILETALFEDICKAFESLTRFNLESHHDNFIPPLNTYIQIAAQNVHPDRIKTDMLRHLHDTAHRFSTYCDEFDDLRNTICFIEEQADIWFDGDTDGKHAVEKLAVAVCECETQYRNNITFLEHLMAQYSVPTESPPHL